MISLLRTASWMLATFTILTGVLYPAFVTLVAQSAFPRQANGSRLETPGGIVGSELLGQQYTHSKYFWGRPSATGPTPYNGMGGSGSNQAPTNPGLESAIRERADRIRSADPDNRAPIPIDLVTASASGLDPHISPAGALYQVGRVAKARGWDEERLRALVVDHVEPPTFGFLGQSRVHVLRLNLAVDASADRTGNRL